VKRTLTTPEFANYPGDWHLSPILDTGEFVFFSGITGTHPNLSIASDPTAQFRDTFKFLLANLRFAGLGFEHVVDTTLEPAIYSINRRRISPAATTAGRAESVC
jgi:enamine deaminase RidA (YjgF/YER057c/UK114 family)